TVQFALIPVGLLLALPFALGAVGGLDACWVHYAQAQGDAARVMPPLEPDRYWSVPRILGWWDLSIMLMLGGIPWNCYLQRVQSCQTPAKAQWHCVVAGLLSIVLTVPPLLLGMAAFGFEGWTAEARRQLHEAPTMALPLLLDEAMPRVVAIAGLT